MANLIDLLREIPLLHFCSYCKRGVSFNGKWIYLSEEDGKIVNNLPNVSHGCCSLCYEQKVKPELDYLRKLRAEKERANGVKQ